MKRLLRIGLGLILPLFLISETFSQEVKLGLLLPFTGQYGWVGSSVAPVIWMVLDEVEQSGGIQGYRIIVRQGDTEGVVDAGALAAQKLINADDVVALIGPTSLSFSGAKQSIIDNQVPMITPTAGTVALDKGCDGLCFRTVPSDSLGSYAIARAATDAFKTRSTPPFYPSGPDDSSIASYDQLPSPFNRSFHPLSNPSGRGHLLHP